METQIKSRLMTKMIATGQVKHKGIITQFLRSAKSLPGPVPTDLAGAAGRPMSQPDVRGCSFHVTPS